MAYIQCNCGKVTVTFCQRMPQCRGECCCVDCFQKNEYFATQAGLDVAPELTVDGRTRPLQSVYYPNKMVVVGEDLLTFNRVRGDADACNCCTTCCQTLLFVDDPYYEDSVVLVFPDYCPLHNALDIEPLFRAWIKDWPSHRKPLSPGLPGFYLDQSTGQMVDPGGVLVEFKACIESAKAVVERSLGKSFSELLACEGGNVEILHIPALPREPEAYALKGFGRRVRRSLLLGAVSVATVMCLLYF